MQKITFIYTVSNKVRTIPVDKITEVEIVPVGKTTSGPKPIYQVRIYRLGTEGDVVRADFDTMKEAHDFSQDVWLKTSINIEG
jgi:hypothetical protein